MLFSVEQAFVGREEIRAPLKMPAWEAILMDKMSLFFFLFKNNDFFFSQNQRKNYI